MKLNDLGRWMEQELAGDMFTRSGKVMEVVGPVVRASGLSAKLGEMCNLVDDNGSILQVAEVVGFSQGQTILSPFGPLVGVSAGRTQVVGLGKVLSVPVGDALLGRVVDSQGQPMDGGSPIECLEQRPVFASPPAPMTRALVDRVLPTGVKAIDSMITLGEGQRVGIFAPAGVGKSTLMGMLARGTPCDVTVIALIGERGREVREFVELTLGKAGMAKSVVVCATSDRSALERAKAAHAATAIAEYFRDRGLRVLLMMDSFTRFARALREIGLAAGESPARRGFPPSVFAEIPRLLERAGMGARGSITALYTVLVEDDSGSDPIGEEVRSILDGHIVLSRKLAERNQYPAIDVLASLSRVMPQIVPAMHVKANARLRKLMAKFDEMDMLIQMGEYKAGIDKFADEAVSKNDAALAFLAQSTEDLWDFEKTIKHLQSLSQE
jgi:ATP synthase in type III secretion protein N